MVCRACGGRVQKCMKSFGINSISVLTVGSKPWRRANHLEVETKDREEGRVFSGPQYRY